MVGKYGEMTDVRLDIDLTAYNLYRDGFPHDVFAALRDAHPVWWHSTTATRRSPHGIDFWVVLGHPEVQQVSRDWQRFSAIEGPSLTKTAPERQGHTIIASDPPGHTRMRKLVNAGFTPRMIARLDDLVVRRTKQVLDEAAARNDVNFVRDVAYPLPMHMIGDIIGIPDDDRPDVFHWTDVITRAADPEQGLSLADQAAAERALFEYARELGAEKRRNPTDDVWSILTVAEIEGDDGVATRLSPLELDQFFLILTIAGSETTRNVISGGLVALLQHPEQMDRLRAEPELLPSATEEMIRWVSPVACFTRTATVDVELGGQTVAAGDRVSLWFPAANRDPRAFAAPDEFDVTRAPNPQVAFGGGGMHFCLGAHLARREIRVMFGHVLARFPDIEIIGPVSYVVGSPEETIAVSLDNVPVRLDPT
jgi:cytochrome P450